MVPPSYMWSVIERNIVMLHMTVLYVIRTTVTYKQVYCQVNAPVFDYSSPICCGLNLQLSAG